MDKLISPTLHQDTLEKTQLATTWRLTDWISLKFKGSHWTTFLGKHVEREFTQKSLALTSTPPGS